MKVTFLGTGTSQGVPVIGCECSVCQSQNSKDKRLRSSILININNENYVIDTGPDFRQQMLRGKVKSLRAVIYTHEHKDHIAGLDDVRAFNFLEKRDMEVFCTSAVEEALKREYSYIFSENKYPGIPSVSINNINTDLFNLPCGEKVTPIEVFHYKMPVLGFRIKDFTYITDAKTVSLEMRERIKGSKVLVVNALRYTEHLSHFNLEEALDFIRAVNPDKAYLTHISHLFDLHENINDKLPENVEVAYDGLELEFSE